jgi:quinohemoprotein ethanol dehydrogenase
MHIANRRYRALHLAQVFEIVFRAVHRAGLAGGRHEPPKSKPFGRLIAWDAVAQKAAWRVEQMSPWNAGTLATPGNLVFQGMADGRLVAYNAKTGEKRWETATGTGVVAAPATYMVDGKQYVSIAVGWGGAYGLAARATELQGPGTVYTFVVAAPCSM